MNNKMKEQMVAAFTKGWKPIQHDVRLYAFLDNKLTAEMKREYTSAAGENEFILIT